MTKPTDDLEAVRVVAEALQGFDSQDQERIIRWAREKLGLVASSALQAPAASGHVPPTATPDIPASSAAISTDREPRNTTAFRSRDTRSRASRGRSVSSGATRTRAVHSRATRRPPRVERLAVERLAPKRPTVERPVVVNPPPPTLTPEEKSRRLFTVIGIIVLTVAVALLIFMITSHPK